MSGTCEGCNGDGGCPVHDPPTCKRCKSEYTMDWPHTEPTAYCDACAHAVAGELTADLATAIAERDSLAETRAALTANLNALTIALGEARSELAEARRQLGEVTRERDALKTCRHVGPWIEDRGTWRRVRTIGEAGAVYHAGWITQTMDGKAWNVASDGLVLARRVALDAAKAAADAHLVAAGYWLDGGPHKAGEAK